MSSRFKKVSLALYLDPTQSKADSYAFTTLSSWAKRRQELSLDASATMELHQLVHVHKDIYLSGLFLYQLKPELAKSMAAALASDKISQSALFDALSLNQIQNANRPENAETKAVESSIPDYNERFDALLSRQEEAQNQISSLKALLNESALCLSEGEDNKKEPINGHVANMPDYSESFKALLSQQADSHQQIIDANKQIASLQQLVQEQNRLIYQLMQQGVNNGSAPTPALKPESDLRSPMLPDEPKELVEQRLAKVQKMKKKGVF